VGALGLVPLLLGIRLLRTAIRERGGGAQPPVVAVGLLSVTGTTLSTGGDNIAAYTAAFRLMSPVAVVLTLAVFLAGTALWCVAGYLLPAHPRSVTWLRRSARWLIPPLYIGLGLHILVAAGLFPRW
jgi:cadmium resistance protein CadD (predicted permease)